MNGRDKALAEIDTAEAPFDFEAFFRCQYSRTAGVIARVIRDPARSEELAVEAFWKLWRHPRVHGEKAAGWLYRAAVTLVLPLPLERGT